MRKWKGFNTLKNECTNLYEFQAEKELYQNCLITQNRSWKVLSMARPRSGAKHH